MERADEVLAVAGIDRGLAADRGIDLRQQRGGNLNIVETTADNRGGKAGEIADDTAAERHHHIGALDARGNQRFADSLEHRETFRSLARWHRHRRGADAGGTKCSLRRGKMVPCDRFVGDDRGLGAAPQRSNFFAQQGQLTTPDDDVVAALAERDIDDGRIADTQRRSHGRRSPSAGGTDIAQARPICPASALTISSTILSCSTSRDCTVISAKAEIGSRPSLSLRRVAPGSSVLSSGPSWRRPIRFMSTSNSALSQIEMPLAAMAARVSGFTNAPPPVASTCGPPSSRRAMTRASPARNSASPRMAKISLMDMPAAFSIFASASTNGTPR